MYGLTESPFNRNFLECGLYPNIFSFRAIIRIAIIQNV